MNILSINNEDICGISKTLADATNKYTKHKMVVFSKVLSVRHVPYDLLWQINCDETTLRQACEWADVINFNDSSPYLCKIGNVLFGDYLKEGKGILCTQHGTALRTQIPLAKQLSEAQCKLLVTMPNMFGYVDDKACKTEWMPFPIPTNDPRFMPIDEEEKYQAFTVVHSPGEPHRWPIKDTDFLLQTLDMINADTRGWVKIVLHTHTPWEQALQEKQKSHVCFDHMQGYYGMNTAEAMSMGLPSITNLGWEYYGHAKKKYGKELPLVTADRVTLKDTITRLRDDHELLKEVGRESRHYAVKVHDLRSAVLPQFIHACKEVYKHG